MSDRKELPSTDAEWPPAERCGLCKFFSLMQYELSEYGHCRRYPKVLLPKSAEAMFAYTQVKAAEAEQEHSQAWGWPVHYFADWCGEYRPTLAHPPAAV